MSVPISLLVTDALPPGDWGSIVLMSGLMPGLDPREWIIVTSAESACHHITRGFRVLPHGFSPRAPVPRIPGAGHLVQLRSLLTARRDAARLAKALEGTSIRQVVGMFPPDFSVLLGCFLAHRLDVPFTLILFDLFRGSRHGFYQPAAWVLEPLSFRMARRVVFLHEGLRRYYADRYVAYDRTEWTIVGHPLDLAWYRQASARTARERSDDAPFRIVFTGSVYHAQRDAVQRMCDVVNGMPPGSVRFEIYTHTPTEYLNLSGIETPNVQLGYRPRDEVPGLQAGADLLLLPLSFHSRLPDVVRTALPAKHVEYLASGVPILVHAPPWSWMAQYFREEQTAYVVDGDDVRALQGAVRRLASDAELRSSISARAGKAAERHDHRKVSARFACLLESPQTQG